MLTFVCSIFSCSQIADIKANGMSAAMKYMNDPVVMAKLSALMGDPQ